MVRLDRTSTPDPTHYSQLVRGRGMSPEYRRTVDKLSTPLTHEFRPRVPTTEKGGKDAKEPPPTRLKRRSELSIRGRSHWGRDSSGNGG